MKPSASHIDYERLRKGIYECFPKHLARSWCDTEGGLLFESLEFCKTVPMSVYRKAGDRSLSSILVGLIIDAGGSTSIKLEYPSPFNDIAEAFLYDMRAIDSQLFIKKDRVVEILKSALKALSRDALAKKANHSAEIRASILLGSQDETFITLTDPNARVSEIEAVVYPNVYTLRSIWQVVLPTLIDKWLLDGLDVQAIIDAYGVRTTAFRNVFLRSLPDAAIDQATEIFKARLLASSPELWSEFGVNPASLLGARMVNNGVFNKDYWIINDLSGVSIFPSRHKGLTKQIFETLKKHAPEAFDKRNIIYHGSRDVSWVKAMTGDYAPVEESRILLEAEVWHRYFFTEDFTQLATLNSLDLPVLDYLLNGGQARLAVAMAVIESNSLDLKPFIQMLSKKSHFTNLSKLRTLKPEEAALIPSKFQRDFMLDSLSL